jgi:hypothetical protein
MALMNRVGVVLYNVSLLLAVLVVVLCLKNYNFDSPADTAEYSTALVRLIYVAVGAFIAVTLIGLVLTAASKARKKGAIYWTLTFALAISILGMVVFTYANPIFNDPLNTTGYVYMIVSCLTAIAFFATIAMVLMQLPGSIDRDKLVKAIKDELKKDVEETLPFCPECKNRVRPEWKYCPVCSAKFSD